MPLRRNIVIFLLFTLVSVILPADSMPDHSGKIFDVTFTDVLRGREIVTVDTGGELLGTLVVFWSMNCSHCLASLPVLNSLYTEWAPRGVQIVGFPQDEDIGEFTDLCRRFGISWPQNLETGRPFNKSAALEWEVTRLPGYLLLDDMGIVLASGFSNPEEAMESWFD